MATNCVAANATILNDIMNYDRLSSPRSSDSAATDSAEDSEALIKRRNNMQLIYDVVKKMCESSCEDAFIFDPKHPSKIVDYPDRDEEGIKRWKEAINYIKNPEVERLRRNSDPETPEKFIKHIKFHVSTSSSTDSEEMSVETMRFANNANPALYACTMHILRKRLISNNNTHEVNKDEKGNRESPIPTWLERMEHKVARIEVPKMPFTSLMPPHPEEIFQHLKHSKSDRSETDSSSKNSQDQAFSDCASQSSSFSSSDFSSDKDSNRSNQNAFQDPRIVEMLDKLGIEQNERKPGKEDNTVNHSSSSSVSNKDSEEKIDSPLTAAKMEDPSIQKGPIVDHLSKEEECKLKTYNNAPLKINAVGRHYKRSNCAEASTREIGYQCPCYFEKYIENTRDAEVKIQALTGNASHSPAHSPIYSKTHSQTQRREEHIGTLPDVVTNIINKGETGINGKFNPRSSARDKHSKSNQCEAKTAEEFILEAIAAARRSNPFFSQN